MIKLVSYNLLQNENEEIMVSHNKTKIPRVKKKKEKFKVESVNLLSKSIHAGKEI